MSVKEMLKTSAKTLADRVVAMERELASLVTAHDQADANAVALSADEIKYAEASEKATEIGRKVADVRQRLDRLRRAHAEQFDQERSAHVAKVESLIAKAEKDKHDGARVGREEVAAEEARHAAALQAIDDRNLALSNRVSDLERRLSWAKNGVPEENAAEACELLAERRSLGRQVNGRLGDAFGRAKRVFEDAERDSRSEESAVYTGAKARLPDARAQFELVSKDYLPLNEKLDAMSERIRSLTKE